MLYSYSVDRSYLFEVQKNTAGIFYLLFIREVIRVNPKSKMKPKPPACHIYSQVDNPT